MAIQRTKQLSVLTMNTLAFTACFAVWVMFSIIGIPIKELLELNETQFGILIATPILTGSLARLPVGMLTYEDPEHRVGAHVTLADQLVLLKDTRIWKYMQYYSLVFGGFVGLSLWMTKYYIAEYGFDLTTAALLAAIFVLPSGLIRALGGWFSDRFGALIDLTQVNSVVFMLLYGATCVSLIWMHYTFARDKQREEATAAKEHVLSTYAKSHERADEYASARAAVEQAHLLEELINKYSAARKAAQAEAVKIRAHQLTDKPADVLE